MRAALMILGRPLAGPAWAIIAELAWHLAGPAWAFTVLAAGLAWLAGRLPAAMAAASSKAYAVETRVDALVPVVASAKNTANTALATIPPNHSFLSGLSTATTGSVSPGAAAGGVPGVNAPFSGQCTVNPASQGYVNALADNVNAIRSDLISVRNYVSAFAGTYNQTVSAVNHIQDQLNAHGYSSN